MDDVFADEDNTTDYRDGERDMALTVLEMINDGAPLLNIRDFLEEAIDEVSVPSV